MARKRQTIDWAHASIIMFEGKRPCLACGSRYTRYTQKTQMYSCGKCGSTEFYTPKVSDAWLSWDGDSGSEEYQNVQRL